MVKTVYYSFNTFLIVLTEKKKEKQIMQNVEHCETLTLNAQ